MRGDGRLRNIPIPGVGNVLADPYEEVSATRKLKIPAEFRCELPLNCIFERLSTTSGNWGENAQQL